MRGKSSTKTSRKLSRKVTRKSSRKPSKKTKCPYGYFLRKGYSYTRKDGAKVRVKSSCIKEKGRKGPARGGAKKSRVIKIKHPGSLKEYGYHIEEPVSKRDIALEKILKAYGFSETIKKLNAISVLFRNTEPQYTKKLERDMEFVRALAGRVKYSRKVTRKLSRRTASKKATRKVLRKPSQVFKNVSKKITRKVKSKTSRKSVKRIRKV